MSNWKNMTKTKCFLSLENDVKSLIRGFSQNCNETIIYNIHTWGFRMHIK